MATDKEMTLSAVETPESPVDMSNVESVVNSSRLKSLAFYQHILPVVKGKGVSVDITIGQEFLKAGRMHVMGKLVNGEPQIYTVNASGMMELQKFGDDIPGSTRVVVEFRAEVPEKVNVEHSMFHAVDKNGIAPVSAFFIADGAGKNLRLISANKPTKTASGSLIVSEQPAGAAPNFDIPQFSKGKAMAIATDVITWFQANTTRYLAPSKR